jgi:hypothetical protein
MRPRRCEVCHGVVHVHDAIQYGWWGQFGEGQVILHRGPCALLWERRFFGPGPDSGQRERAG